MRILIVFVAASLSALLFAAPAPAQAVPPADGQVAGQAEPAGQPGLRESYLQKAQSEMAVWRARMDQWGADARGAAVAADNDAARDLHAAWLGLETASQRLRSAGADAWDAAQRTYERAADDLAATWRRVHPAKT